MVLGESVLWAIVLFAIVASEGEVNFDPAALTLQTMSSPASQSRWVLLTFNLGTAHCIVSRLNVA
jgi:hypothetical protein